MISLRIGWGFGEGVAGIKATFQLRNGEFGRQRADGVRFALQSEVKDLALTVNGNTDEYSSDRLALVPFRSGYPGRRYANRRVKQSTHAYGHLGGSCCGDNRAFWHLQQAYLTFEWYATTPPLNHSPLLGIATIRLIKSPPVQDSAAETVGGSDDLPPETRVR